MTPCESWPTRLASTRCAAMRSASGGSQPAAWKMAELVHPERPLSRGFVRVTDRAGRTLTHAADARDARELSLRFGDGEIDAVVEGKSSRRRVERPAKRSYLPPQPGLFDRGEE